MIGQTERQIQKELEDEERAEVEALILDMVPEATRMVQGPRDEDFRIWYDEQWGPLLNRYDNLAGYDALVELLESYNWGGDV